MLFAVQAEKGYLAALPEPQVEVLSRSEHHDSLADCVEVLLGYRDGVLDPKEVSH